MKLVAAAVDLLANKRTAGYTFCNEYFLKSFHVILLVSDKRTVLHFENFDLENIVTPVKVSELQQLLEETNYDKDKTAFLVDGFTSGFDLGYRGKNIVKIKSPNLKFTIGDEIELWNKVMKEVELKRYAGPFEDIPFTNYIQSPIGLVPKDGGLKTRLIFHLSYPRK